MLSHLLRTISGVFGKNVQFVCQHFNRVSGWICSGNELLVEFIYFSLRLRFCGKKIYCLEEIRCLGFEKYLFSVQRFVLIGQLRFLKLQNFQLISGFEWLFCWTSGLTFPTHFSKLQSESPEDFLVKNFFRKKLLISWNFLGHCLKIARSVWLIFRSGFFLIALYQCRQMFE